MIGLAIHSDEYVPLTIPISKTIQNSLIVVPPKKINPSITNIVVIDVFNVRTNV